MASTVQLKRRIRTAQNISKTTRAMNMIATSKLKRAQEHAIASRPYAEKMQSVVSAVARNIEKGDKTAYLKENNSKRDLFIVIGSDKGLTGGMTANLVREYQKQTKDSNAYVIIVGKKMESYAVRSKKEILAAFPFGNTLPLFSAVYPIVEILDEYFLSGKVDNVYIVTTTFKNVFSQSPKTIELLPIVLPAEEKTNTGKAIQLFEPSVQEILPILLRRYIEMTIYHNMLESYAAEQAARMTAMKNATDNAKDIIEDLKLVYNKSRQEKITNELLDISGSAFVT